MEIKQYIKENEERFLNELFSLIRIPSISALPQHKDDMLLAPNVGNNCSSKPVPMKLWLCLRKAIRWSLHKSI
jgi:hypothetical protein